MKTKARWLLLIIPLALFVWAFQAASWRPKLIGAQPTPPMTGAGTPFAKILFPLLLVSPNGEYLTSVAALPTGCVLTMWASSSRERLWQEEENMKSQFPLAFSPDGHSLATLKSRYVLGDAMEKIVLLDAASGKVQNTVVPVSEGLTQSAAFLSNRELVVSTSRGASVVDTQTGKAIRQWSFKLPVLQIATRMPPPPQSHVSADGTTVIALDNGISSNKGVPGPGAGHHDETIVALYNAKTGEQRGTWTYPGAFRNPRLSPDGNLWILRRTKDDLADIYDAHTGQKLWGPFVTDNTSLPWTWSADGQRILASFDTRVALIDARTGRNLAQLTGNFNTQALALAPNDDHFYTLDDIGKIWRWRAR